MGLNSKHALGRERKFFAKTETTAGTYIKVVGADAVKVLTSQMDIQTPRNIRSDSRQTRSPFERITQKGTVNWSAEGFLIPSGAAGTAPDADPLFEAAFGVATNTPATRHKYTLANSQTPNTLTLLHQFSLAYQEAVFGAWVEECKVTVTGGESPKVSWSGQAMGFTKTGTSEEAVGQTGTVLTPKNTGSRLYDPYAFGNNSLVSVGSDDNILLSAADYTTPAFTMDSSITTAADDAIVPYAPTEVTAGSPIAGTVGSFRIEDAGTGPSLIPITGFEFTLKNNFKPFDDEAFEAFPSDFVPLYREVTGQVTLRAREDMLPFIGRRDNFQQNKFTCQMGTSAGSIVIAEFPQIEYDFAAVDIPEAEEAIITLPFTALASSAEDEMSLSFE